VPAWISSHSDPAEALRGVSRTTKDTTSLPQRSLIVVQAALSLVMLVAAGLLAKSLNRMQHQDFGLQTENRYVVHISPAGAGYKPETLPALNRQLEEQFGALPGVKSVGLALYSTLEGNNWGEAVYVEGRPDPGPNGHIGSSWDRVSSRFFETVGQPVIRGRGLTDQDTATTQKVAVVNQAFVKKFFPKEDPIGKRFGVFEQKYSSMFTIVGIVADAKYTNPRQEFRTMYFRPLTQTMDGLTDANEVMAEGRSLYINSVTMRFERPPVDLDAMVRKTLQNINPNLTVIDMESLDDQVAGNFNQERLIARLTMMFGVLALVLASVGLYGITSYQVARRTSEIGLRMALGANRGDVVKMVLRGALTQAGIGMAIGIPVALLAAQWMKDQLFEVKTYDPLSLLTAVVVLLLSATVAGFVPARRAAGIQPMDALRTE
jgi:predicted permease